MPQIHQVSKAILVASILLWCSDVMAQHLVSGRVTDAKTGESLPEVNIVVVGTTLGTTTNARGAYSLNVPAGFDSLAFSFIGFQRQTVAIAGRTVINVQLEQETVIGGEVVVVGYGQQAVRSLTGAVSSVTAETLEDVTVPNATQLFQGRMPGVFTKQASGLPGDDDVDISIRGFGTPLVLVDGIERDLTSVDPGSIESISVLKDASAAIYGARAGNGVVLVTTKRGRNQRPQIDYRGTYTAQQFTHKPRFITDSGTYTELWNEALLNRGLPPKYSDEEIQNYKDGAPGFESYDWYKFAFKEWTPMQRHTMSVRGGSESIGYFANIGFTDQQGAITSNDFNYKRYNIATSVDATIAKNLTTKIDFDYAYDFQRTGAQTGINNLGSIMRAIYFSQPMAPTNFPDTTLIPVSNFTGAFAQAYAQVNSDLYGHNETRRKFLTGNAELAYQVPFLDGMSATVGFAYTNNTDRNDLLQKTIELHQQTAPGVYTLVTKNGPANNNYLQFRDINRSWYKYSATLNYRKKISHHSIEAMGVAEYIDESAETIVSIAENLISDKLPSLAFGDPARWRNDQSISEMARGSFVGRLRYSLSDKYLLESTFRYDGSSVFPPGERWGFFPSISAGWIISEEGFLKNRVPGLRFLKLRGSYSKMGNDRNAVLYDYFSGFNSFSTPPYIFGTTALRRLRAASLPNLAMTWENMTIYNAGIDATIFGGGLDIFVDAFYRKRSNILAVPVEGFPSTFGATLSRANLNSMDNRGVELMLAHRGRIGGVNYDLAGNVSYTRAKWIHFEEEDFQTEVERRLFQNSGKWQNRTIGYVSDGLFRSQEEINNHPINQDGNGNKTLIPGDIKYVDLDGDGAITFMDQKVIGHDTGQPDVAFGMNIGAYYKNFSLSILLQGASGFAGDVIDFARNPFTNGVSTPLELHWEERFHPVNNPNGSLPSVTLSNRANNNKTSDFWLKEIRYLRLENIRLGYRVPDAIFGRYGVRNLEAYVAGNNVAVLSNLGIYSRVFDPEGVLNVRREYPPHRTITFGVNLGL